MVSHHTQPPPPYTSDLHLPSITPSAPLPSHNRASSVTSTRSHTRRHRHARTHLGGSSSAYLQQNEFPVFSNTGDVEIVIRSKSARRENRYLLHRLILSQCSGFFEAGTRAEWSRGVEDTGSGAAARARAALATIAESSVVSSSSRASSSERRPSLSHEEAPQSRRWHYALDWRCVESDDTPMLVQQPASLPSIFGDERPPSVHNKPPASNASFFRSMTNFSALSLSSSQPPASSQQPPYPPGDEILNDYDNLLRTIYQYPPLLDTVNIATAYTECKALLHLADMYDALEVVGSRVDHHLLRFGARLLKQIAKYPPSYLRLGYLARSRTIFTEALIHVVGQWPLAAPQLRGQVDTGVMDLIEDKVEDLETLRTRVEAKLWRLNLTTPRGERVTPANDYLSWLAVSLLRQWMAENSAPEPQGVVKEISSARPGTGSSSHHASPHGQQGSRSTYHIATQRAPAPAPPPPIPPPPGKIYRLLGSPLPSACLTHEELKRFLKLNPDLYTRENLRRFERRMDELKSLAREIVKPLMRNSLELDLGAFGPAGLGYLTCTRVEGRDLPWED